LAGAKKKEQPVNCIVPIVPKKSVVTNNIIQLVALYHSITIGFLLSRRDGTPLYCMDLADGEEKTTAARSNDAADERVIDELLEANGRNGLLKSLFGPVK